MIAESYHQKRVAEMSLRVGFIVLLSVVSNQRAFAQSADSLRHVLKDKKLADSTRALTLAELAYVLYWSNPDSSIQIAKRSNQLSERIKFSKGQGAALRVIGVYYGVKGDFDKALSDVTSALNFSLAAHDLKNIGRCYNNLALINHNRGDYTHAIEWHLKSLKLREQIGDKIGMGETCNSIAMLSLSIGEISKAKEYALRALDIHNRIHSKRGVGYAYGSLAAIYQDEGDYQKAMEYLLKNIAILEEIGDTVALSGAYCTLGEIYLSLGKSSTAKPYLDKSIAIANKLKSDARLAFINAIYAIYYNAVMNPIAAYESAKSVDRFAQKIGGVQLLKIAAHEKYIACTRMGRYQEALINHEKYITFRDSIQNLKNTRRLVAKEFELKEEKLRADQNKLEIEHNAEIRLMQNENDLQRKVKFFFIVGFLIALVLVIIIFLSYKKRTILNSKLSSQNEEIKVQNELIESINKELHARALRAQLNPHFIFNSLNSIESLVIERKTELASDYIGKFAQLLRRVMIHSEESWISLDDEITNLRSYIELESLRLGHQFQFHIICNVETSDWVKIPPMILQPYVENAIHHGLLSLTARARMLQINFTESDNCLVAEVTDNGVGRKKAAEMKVKGKYSQSKGMSYTLERIRVLNTLSKTVSSVKIYDLEQDGEAIGTKVVVKIALPQG